MPFLKLIPFYRKKSLARWCGLRVDVGSKSAKIALVYWIRGKEDRGKRGRGRRKAVIVGGEVPCSWTWSGKRRDRGDPGFEKDKGRDRGGEKCRVRGRRKAVDVFVLKPHKTAAVQSSMFKVQVCDSENSVIVFVIGRPPVGGTSTFREFSKRRNEIRNDQITVTLRYTVGL